eukprot:4952136-Amphidinium_carterae.1
MARPDASLNWMYVIEAAPHLCVSAVLQRGPQLVHCVASPQTLPNACSRTSAHVTCPSRVYVRTRTTTRWPRRGSR